jgi:osmotically-inducible protein OsmY
MRSPNSLPFFLAAAMGGMAFMYYADPQNGRRRRHVTRDKALSLTRHGAKRSRRLVHHITSDAKGYVERARHAGVEAEQLDDQTLVDKVESIVFRDRDVPKGKINVNAENGVVFLRGEVASSELVETLETRVRKVHGVRDVTNLLHAKG